MDVYPTNMPPKSNCAGTATGNASAVTCMVTGNVARGVAGALPSMRMFA